MNRVRKIILAVVGGLLICCLGIVAIALISPDPEEIEVEPTVANRSQGIEVEEVKAEEEPRLTVTVEPTELPTEAPEDTATPEPTVTASYTPLPTNTLQPTSTPLPSNTPTSLPPTATNTQPPPPPATNTQAPPPPPTATAIIVNTEPPPPNPSGCVSINNAGVEDLKRIIHIDDTRALDLIAKRPYTSLNQLTRIKGIGDSRLADILAQGIACLP